MRLWSTQKLYTTRITNEKFRNSEIPIRSDWSHCIYESKCTCGYVIWQWECYLWAHMCVWPVSSWMTLHLSVRNPQVPVRRLEPVLNPLEVRSQRRTQPRWPPAARWRWPVYGALRRSWRSSWHLVEGWTDSLVETHRQKCLVQTMKPNHVVWWCCEVVI